MIFPAEIRDEDEALDWWDNRADEYVARGILLEAAGIVHTVIASLRQVRAAAADATLTLADAAAETGYSAKQIGRWVKTGKLANVGTQARPRVRRADALAHRKAQVNLPRRPAVSNVLSAQDIARSVANPRGKR